MSRILAPQDEQIIAWLGEARFPVQAIAECVEVAIGTVHNRLSGKVPIERGNLSRFPPARGRT